MKSIKNYQQALEYLGGKKERPYANNTRIVMDTLNLGHDVITVTYHGNSIVNFYPNRTSFDSCGWKTSTTKERINWFLPEGFYLYQKNSAWILVKRGYVFPQNWGFADGITIDSAGSVHNAASETSQDEIKAQIKAIKAYVNGFVTALVAGDVPSPSGGDCWYCYMFTEGTSSSDHITSHIEESYFVPSMLINAFKFRDVGDLIKSFIAQIWQDGQISAYGAELVKRYVKGSLTAYLKHALGIAA